MRWLSVAGALLLCALTTTTGAASFKWASQGDILTLDPYALNDSLSIEANLWVYEPLVRADEHFRPAPALAVSWQQVTPTLWRFKLREGVSFQDGTPFTAEDAAFSIQRALAPSSQYKSYAAGVKEVKAVDPLTLEVTLFAPNPVFLQQLMVLGMMSKAWCETHRATVPQNLSGREETFASQNAMGTGPFMLKSREVDVKTVYVENPNWWGKSTKKGNVTEIVYTPIKQDATRSAALLSGELDFVLDPPPQDLDRMRKQVKVLDGNEYRTIFIGLDQGHAELKYSNLKGVNPFKDKRVREALYRAIDIQAIHKFVMRGVSAPTGTMIAPQVHGWSAELARRVPYDLNKAKALLTEAGYGDGFELTLDCPNNRYINDAIICQAVVAMWAKIGVRTKLNAIPRGPFFSKLAKFDTSAYLLGWGAPTFDAYNSLEALIHSRSDGAVGDINYGFYQNAEVDRLIDAIKIETDLEKRDEMIHQALAIFAQEFGSLPLHDQVIPWAMQKNINLIHRADNRPVMDWVTVD